METYPRIAAIILAAGSSLRMGNPNKLLEELKGRPLIRIAVEAALNSIVEETIVVTGFEAHIIRSLIDDLPIRVVHNPDHSEGMSTSLRIGLSTVGPEIEGAIVLLADMPHVDAALINKLIRAFHASEAAAAVPVAAGRRGNPVLWSRRHFRDLMAVQGDKGGRDLLQELANITEISIQSDSAFTDIDTPEDLIALQERPE